MRISEAVKQLIIINVLVFIGAMAADNFLRGLSGPLFHNYGQLGLAAFYVESEFFRPFQIATHMFMHGSVNHIFFNMFGLYMFGSVVEQKVGIPRFLQIYFFSGLAAFVAQNIFYAYEYHLLDIKQIIYVPMLGASGAVMGIYAAAAMLYPNLRVMLIIPPIPMKLKHLMILFIAIDLYMGVFQSNSGVAHFAHLGGAIVGILLVKFWYK